MTLSKYINCYQIKMQNSSDIVTYCASDVELVIDGVVAKKNSGLCISEITNKFSQLESNYELIASYDDFINKDSLYAGQFEGARVDFYLYDLFAHAKGKIIKRGFVCAVELNDKEVIFTLQPLVSYLFSNRINQNYSQTCRAKFGDKRCGLDLVKINHKLGYQPQCDKSYLSCQNYNNLTNFRGE
jgi:uncharacterized phage protein (TIGR02218 family)